MNQVTEEKAPFPKIQTLVLLGLGFCIVVVALRYLSTILQPLFIAILVCYLAVPIRQWLVRWHFPGPLATLAVPFIFIGFVLALAWMASLTVQILKSNLPTYRDQISILVNTGINWSKHFPPTVQEFLRKGVAEYRQPLDARSLVSGLNLFATGLGTASAVVFYIIFLLLDAKTLPERISGAYGENRGKEIQGVISKINQGIFAYIRLKSLVSLATALFCGLVMLLFKVDVWWFWAVLIYLGNFIPYVGSTVACIFPVLVYFLATGDLMKTGLLALALFVAQNFVDAFLEPRVAGQKLNLSPLVVIVSLAFWGWLWGIVGMIVAVPVLVAVKITLEQIPGTYAFAQLLGERVSK